MLPLAQFLALAAPAAAHIALWHPAQYGQNDLYSNPYHEKGWATVVPLRDFTFNQWWFHGSINDPPPEGQFMELPAGSVFTANISCFPNEDYPMSSCALGGGDTKTFGRSDDNQGSLHSVDRPGTPIDKLQDVRGCSLAIAYESDPHKVKPEDFAVISVNHTCPWIYRTDFEIPAGLPKCPPGGCHCLWGWTHSDSGTSEMYQTAVRCNVTGEVGTVPIPKPQVARKCPVDKNNCTRAAKQPHYYRQLEGNNNFQHADDTPFYNDDYGFPNGAQRDLWDTDNGTTWNDEYCSWAPGPVTFKGTWNNWPRTTWFDDQTPLEKRERDEGLRPGCSSPTQPALLASQSVNDTRVAATMSEEDINGKSSQTKFMLKYLNDFRAQFGAKELQWNATVTRMIAEGLPKCQGAELATAPTDNVNSIWVGTKDDRPDARGIFDGWAKQWNNHVSGNDTPDDFTRLVWRSSTSVGCGWSSSPNCKSDDGLWTWLRLTCVFSPSTGDYAQNVGKFQFPMANATAPPPE